MKVLDSLGHLTSIARMMKPYKTDAVNSEMSPNITLEKTRIYIVIDILYISIVAKYYIKDFGK